MTNIKEFTFYWLNGEKEVIKGTSPADAVKKSGYDSIVRGGALRNLDFYAEGDNKEYEWDETRKFWRMIKKELDKD